MELQVRHISENELEIVISILKEAAYWLKNENKEMWTEAQLSIEALSKNYAVEEMFIGVINYEAAAAMILQSEDSVFWPGSNDSLFLHKLAVRREYAKQGVSKGMIHWAIRRAKHLNKAFVRLDCAADRPKLCQFYESQGFKKVSEKVLFGKYPTAFYEFEIS